MKRRNYDKRKECKKKNGKSGDVREEAVEEGGRGRGRRKNSGKQEI